MRLAASALALLLAGCSEPRSSEAPGAPEGELERAAIAAGVVRDPANTDLTGLYGRDSDRICVVPDRVGYRIGASVDYGGGQSCSGSGRVTRSGETLRVDFDEAEGCSFDAKFDGERIDFPARLPAACERLCQQRASFAALEAELLSEGPAEAATLRDSRGRLLCRGTGA